MPDDLHEVLQRLRRAADRLDEDLDELLLRCVDDPTGVGRTSDTEDGADDAEDVPMSRLSRATKRLLQRLARPGTARFSLRPREDGRAVVQLADSEAFVLPPKLALLLEIIAQEEQTETGRFVRFRTHRAIARELQRRSGGTAPIQPHAVTQLVRRLREALLAHDVNPFLVETRRRTGVRLRYRRRGKERA